MATRPDRGTSDPHQSRRSEGCSAPNPFLGLGVAVGLVAVLAVALTLLVP